MAAVLRASASSAEQPAADIQEKQDSPPLADSAPGKALNSLGTCHRNGITSAEQPEQLILSSGQRCTAEELVIAIESRALNSLRCVTIMQVGTN